MATATRNGKSPDAIGRRLRDECRDLLSAPFSDQRRRLESLSAPTSRQRIKQVSASIRIDGRASLREVSRASLGGGCLSHSDAKPPCKATFASDKRCLFELEPGGSGKKMPCSSRLS
jgi:hypothetical protein